MSNPATVIGAQTHIRGNLEGDEDLTIIGRVDGNINLTKTLTVDPRGIVVADVQVQRAIISGTVVGNVAASDLVHITEQGRIVGDLTAPRVVLVDGAAFSGNIDMGDMDAPASSGMRVRPSRAPTRPRVEPAAKAPTPAPRPAPPPRKVVPQARAPRQSPPPAPAPTPKPTEDALDKRAEAAARAVASAQRREESGTPSGRIAPKKVQSGKKPPKPPTTAGKRTRARTR